MKAKTYNDYYNILLKGCKEAFKAIELKEFLYTDEAMEDNKEYFISKESIEQIGINRSNNLIVNYQIEKDIKIDFIRFLDRQQQLFEKKHLIPRNEFYKKCLNALNIKLTELNKQEYRILSGISDMGTPPDPLLFLEYMKWDIKNKSLQTNETPEPQQTETVIPDEVKKELYNHIFKGNAFEVFEKYHSTKSLAENSKTDLNLLFQLFENDNLFVETVELKHYIKWLNSKYIYSLTELKKVNINSRPNIQRTNDYNEYKKTTLKQP